MEEEENGGIRAIADDLLNKAPEISEHVITQEQENQEQKQTAAYLDNTGGTFDPHIHAVDENGNPVKTASGAFRKRSGRKTGATASEPTRQAPKSQLGNTGASNPPLVDPQTIAAGKAAAAILFQAGIIIGGEEWHPQVNATYGLNEPAMIEGAFIDYFKSQGIIDFPPGVALSIALISYAAPRFLLPKTKSRVEKVIDWIKGKFGKGKKETKKEDD